MVCMSSFVSLDFETTGAQKDNQNLPWQLGLVKWDAQSGEILLTKSWYLHVPQTHVFNSYTPGRWADLRDTLAASPSLKQLWGELSPLLLDSLLVAHNTSTERNILKQHFPLHEFSNWIDTLKLFRIAYPALPSYTLGDLLDTFQLTPGLQKLFPLLAPHDALYDAAGCGMLLQYLRSFPDWNNLSNLL